MTDASTAPELDFGQMTTLGDVARYQALKAADLSKAAAAFLPADKRVITVVTPTPGAPRAGRLLEVR